jgi:uncharacterized protein YggU (UPF0235/DUF167 family)
VTPAATPRSAQPWRVGGAGIRMLVRATPKSAREGVDGLAETAQGPALAVRVRAAPDKGEANRAVERVVAEWLGVARSTVAVSAGGKARIKTVEVAGDPARLAALVAARLAGLG